jgi:NodT family efflux transporter outer membrane factor (OMF) lipoprotein
MSTWAADKAARPVRIMLQAACVVLPLGGCWITGKPPEPGLDIPPAYSAGPKKAALADAATPKLDWWRAFRSRELTDILDNASVANLDIAAAVARIVQADAQSRITGAALLPQVDLNGSANRSRPSQSTSGGSGSFGASEHDLLSTSLTASYEIDFWGKNRFALRAQEETAIASRYDRDVVALTTLVTAANSYFQVLAAQDRLRVAQQNLVSAKRVATLIGERQKAGTASALEVAQQQSVVDTINASIPPLVQTVAQYRNALAVLLARSPESVHIRGGSLNAIAIPHVTPGLPSELLARRPDIREAEAQLAAANANVANARAQFLPSITLTGEGGYQSAVLKTLLRPESAFYTLTAGLTQPIFEGGRLLGNLDQQKGRQDELLQDYRKSVISGFSDVETALTSVQQTALRERLQRAVVVSSRQAFDISEQRLREGTIDLVTVLQTQQTLYSAQDTLVLARLAHIQAIVSLYQALGGGWSPKPLDYHTCTANCPSRS